MTGNTRPTQAQLVLDYITAFGSITQLEAFRDLGVMRLASRVSELKKKGYEIESKPETVKNRFGKKISVKRYRLAEETAVFPDGN